MKKELNRLYIGWLKRQGLTEAELDGGLSLLMQTAFYTGCVCAAEIAIQNRRTGIVEQIRDTASELHNEFSEI